MQTTFTAPQVMGRFVEDQVFRRTLIELLRHNEQACALLLQEEGVAADLTAFLELLKSRSSVRKDGE